VRMYCSWTAPDQLGTRYDNRLSEGNRLVRLGRTARIQSTWLWHDAHDVEYAYVRVMKPEDHSPSIS
jgi:hypothetical protein